MGDPTMAVMDLADELAAAPDAAAFHSSALAGLARLISAEQVFWIGTDFARQQAVIRGDAATPGWLGERLGYVGPTHPAIRSYVAAPHDLTPRRMSDVAGDREWHASPAYEECFSAFGAARQLSLVTSVDPQGIGTGWTLTRSGRDFTAAELALACRLAPVLLAVERRHAFVPTPSYPITEREREVLGLLADGLTAAAIGRRCGITERTARKHLTAIYAKLGCQDRLVAVSLARSSGLLPR